VFLGVHHIAIICSDFQVSKTFYTEILGFKIIKETYRQERNSYKLDLSLNDVYTLELFSFPNVPQRISMPEASGLRHLALSVISLTETVKKLNQKGVECEKIRTDQITGKQFTFFRDPDFLPIEIYEV
jgi:glyoxylase I family protein